MQSPDERHDDGRKSIAGRDAQLQTADGSGHLADSGKARSAATQQQRKPDIALVVEASVRSRRRRETGDEHSIPRKGLAGEQP